MSHATKFKKLLEPLQIKQVKFRNRLVKTPQDTCFANPDGTISLRNLNFYETLARGGVGAIIVEHAYVDFSMGSRDLMLSVADDKIVPPLAKLAEAVHRLGCPLIQQINHLGPQYDSKSASIPALAPSALCAEYAQTTFGRSYNLRELSIPEIEGIVEKFARAAKRVREAGLDGVEIHADHIYLLNSFLSRVWNKRTDEYGCQTLENRTRFAVAVLRASRELTGKDFLIGIKLNGIEYGSAEGTTPQESQQFARIFENVGADYITVTGDGYGVYGRISLPEQVFYPEPPSPAAYGLDIGSVSSGTFVPQATAIKKVVSVPVIVVGGLGPMRAEQILRRGMVDAVAMGRRLLADPELPDKIMQGKWHDVRQCILCGSCADLYARNQPIACSVNAALGKEGDSEIKPATKRKRVLVVGGGPAGMEAARVASQRGHQVILFEKEPALGGLLPLAALIKGTGIFDFSALVSYLRGQIDAQHVNIRLGEVFTSTLVQKIKPDAVILAAGAVPDIPDIPGVDRDIVLTSQNLQRRVKFWLRLLGTSMMERLTKLWLPIGKKVIIIGGLMHGCELAEFLVKRGRKVTVLEAADQLGVGIPEIPYRRLLLKWLAQKGVASYIQVKFKKITDKGVIIINKEGQEQTIEADTILLALPPKPNNELLRELEGKVPKVYQIGDGKTPGLIIDAIADGFRIGRTI